MTKYKTVATSLTYPSAWIVTNNRKNGLSNDRGRRKIYSGNKIYLDDGQEFELEIFNPTSSSVLTAIAINGKKISNAGLVLRPGERVYLDCFFETKKKFIFKSYTVENSNEAKQAMQANGIIDINFYKEKEVNHNATIFDNSPTITITDNSIPINTYQSYSTLGGTSNSSLFGGTFTNTGKQQQTLSGGLTSFNTANTNSRIYTDNNFNLTSVTSLYSTKSVPVATMDFSTQIFNNKIETGRIESGSNSDQTFETINMDFETRVLANLKYFLLPEKTRPITIEDFQPKVYCPSCGKKLKGSSDNFCSSCGTKIK